jgi:ubiquinone/menaquinone biosynthesis C-methylase UbiE
VETAVRDSAVEPVGNLLELVAINMGDEVLEIGCGVGRIGRELAPHCSRWTGADVSGNMLACASKRLRELNNVKLVKLQGFGLEGFATNSFDVIYSTNVFAHLDEVDRWRYVEDSLRVLRPAGRLFIDNVDLESEDGWSAFAEGAKSAHQTEFSPYLPRFSTTAEMMTYAKRAGFERVQSYQRPPLLVVTAIKPSQNECTE